jgi:hypothetical protein
MSDILTEEQAKTKWCPYVRVSMGPNRNQKAETHLTCLASNCMAWRSVWSETAGDARGYCGAFGKPLGV